MKPTMICTVLFMVASMGKAQSGEAERTLNLNGMHPLSAQATGPMLILSFTNEPPELFDWIKPKLTPLKRREVVEKGRRVQVVFGKDILGVAEVWGVSKGAVRTGSTGANVQSTGVRLFFESEEQAAMAAWVLRPSDAPLKPLKK